MLRVGLLGLGFAGQAHLAAFSRLDDVRVVAVSGGGSAAPPDTVHHADPADVVHSPDVDAVVVALPTYLHVQYGSAALEAGKSVLIEKPLALDVDHAGRLVDVAADSPGVAMAGHVLRHHCAYRAATEVLASGRLGAITALTTSRRSSPPSWATWFSRPDLSGGALFDLLVHDLDVIGWLLGAPASVRATGVPSPGGTWDYVEAVLRYAAAPDRHVRAMASNLYPASYPFTSELHVLGNTGALELDIRHDGPQVDDPPTVRLNVHRADGSIPVAVRTPDDPFVTQAQAFVEAVRTGVVPDGLAMRDGAQAVAVAHAIRSSVDTGDEIALDGRWRSAS